LLLGLLFEVGLAPGTAPGAHKARDIKSNKVKDHKEKDLDNQPFGI
jgi:hypothetical protein